MLLWEWHETEEDVDAESEKDIEEDLDEKSLNENEASRFINRDPKENEDLLGRDCFSCDIDSIKFCFLRSWTAEDMFLSAMDLDRARDMLITYGLVK